MSDDRVILLTNRGDGVDEVPNDEEYIEDDPEEISGNVLSDKVSEMTE